MNMMSLVEENGILHWRNGMGQPRRAGGGGRALRGAGGPPAGEVITQMQVQRLDVSEVAKFLSDLDAKMTPNQGLRRWNGTALTPVAENEVFSADGPRLVLIHGTFSSNDNLIDELRATSAGAALLTHAWAKYKDVLTFDHPTIAVSPMLNALDLGRRLAGVQGDIDVVCHSRGGLVTRWWLEAFDRAPGARRAVLVGSPLDGTSLASPPRLRNVMSWLTNLNKVIAAGLSPIPFLHVVGALARLTAVVTNAAAQTPVLDAAVALIPGLVAQSRVQNNFELNRLNIAGGRRPDYFAIKSNFQTDKPGWEFWKYFVDTKKKVLDGLTDLVFARDNDLVVDTDSMIVIGKECVRPDRVFAFPAGDTVYHTNYFRQPDTLKHIGEWLEIP
jgi:hypothetical protein